MSKNSAIAKNYSKALFKAALKAETLEKIKADLAKFTQNFTKDFAAELQNPAISKKDSLQIAKQICDKLGFAGLFADFLATMFENKRVSYFKEIAREFEKLTKAHDGILEVKVISAADLEDADLNKIKEVLASKYQNKKIEIKKSVSPQILGGVQIKIGSNLLDASLKTQLSSLERQLIEVVSA